MRIGLLSRLRGFGLKLEAVAAGEAPRPETGDQPRLFTPARSFRRYVAHELTAEEDRWFPWCVVAFGAGILLYFDMGWEPARSLALAAVVVGLICGFGATRSPDTVLRFVCALMAAGTFGFAAAKLRTERVDAPAVTKDIGPISIAGRVEDVSILAPTKARLVLKLTRFGRESANIPDRVRLTLVGTKSVETAVPGALVSAYAVIRPPPEPALPHGYDFARWAYFQGIGGVGFTYGAPKITEPPSPPSLIDRFNASVEKLRLSMTARIERAIPGPDGEIAAALITGERGGITENDNNAYRDSGLAHVLSISGVHLALAGLGIFWTLRALLALWPRLALTQPIKKWAAIAAFLSSTFYLVISGGGSPAVRSYIMLSAMLLGVVADRPALSMRAVAIAALAILAYEPEDIVNPSFQMSFAAVVGLIALAEWISSRRHKDAGAFGRGWRLFRHIRHYILMMLATSIVATLATAPFAIYHFDRAALYSLLANLLAEPVVAFVIMPAAAIAVVAMPLGLEAEPLKLMGWGVHMMTRIAHWVASLPGAADFARAWPASALIVIVFGALWIALWRPRWRWLGLMPIASGFVLILASVPADVFIERDAKAMAVRGGDGKLLILGPHPDEYTASQWLQRDGDKRKVAEARLGARCDATGCVATAKNGRVVALSLKPEAVIEDCAKANILVAAVVVRRCDGPGLVLNRFDILRIGATALTLDKDEIKIETVTAERGERPWTKHGKDYRTGRGRRP
ncbi:MAG TPA: ComEC/Rec2 family competence protein [Micropepsaceae bacterium]|nr:ComEC/Rec2 family competence protein [Micropepsaceae bacterium]